MKKITLIPFLAFLLLMLSTIFAYSQNTNVTFDNTNASLTTTPACSLSQCNAQDVTFGSVYLGDNVGNVATLAYVSNPVNGLYIWVTIASNSSKYDLMFQFDYLVGGVRKNFDNTNFVGAVTDRLTIKIRGSIITAGSKYRMAQITNYTAGQSLELKNIYLGWETNGQAITPSQSLSLITCNPPKCSSAYSNGIIIKTPLFADFSITKSCDGGSFQKVVYASTSTGVEPNTNYSWSFPGAATISPVSLTTIGPYTVTYSSAGPFSASLTVSDPTNQVIPNTKTVNNITVTACCTTPVITAMTSTICSGSTFTATPANGTNGTVPAGTTYSWAAPSVIGITGTAAGSNAANISGTLTNTTNAPINVVYTVTPTSGTCTGSTFTVTVTVNPKPALNNITATSICSGDTFTTTPANGTNGTVPTGTTYSWAAPSVIGITGTAAGSNAANISGTLTNTTNAPINVVYTVTPTSGTCTGSTFTVTVTVNPKPALNNITATSICSGDTFTTTPANGTNGTVPTGTTYSWAAPSVIGITGTAAGSNAANISGTLTNTTNAPINVVYTVTPTSGTCTGSSFTVTVTVNPLPVCLITGSDGPLCPSSTANSYSAPAGMSNYTWSISGNATISGNLSGQTVLVNTGTTCSAPFTLTVVIKDINGCESTCTKVINVQDITAPTWTTAPAALDVTLQCSDTAGLTTAQANAPIATDNCGGTVSYTKVSGAFVAGNCINSGTYTNTWTATDVCTNVSTVFTQTITIQDTTAPTWTTAPAALDVTLQCSDTAGLTTAQANAPIATDNCGGTVTYTKVSGAFVAGNCINSGTYTNTWTATDVCTNVSTVFTQTITIQDTTAPTWTTAPAALDVTLQCSDTAGLTTAQANAPIATDNCGGTVTYTKVSGAFVAGNCINSGTYTNTWTATDVCTNVSTVFTQTITIQDTTAPTWTTAPAALDVTLQCSDTAGLTTAQANAPIATDNCGGTVTYTKVSGAFVAGNCINSGTYTNTWTATDVCTNVSTVFTQTITIQDTTAPTWTTAPAALDVTLQCSDTAGLTTAQANAPIATDNCGGTVTYTKVSGAFVAGNCINSGTYTNTWTATDVCTNVSTVFTQTITIQDTTAPTWTTAPAALDVTLQCSDTAGLTTAQTNAPIATDNCGGTVTYTKVSGAFVAGNCINSGTYTNTWTATDVCTNVSTVFTQTITIQDTTAPTWTTAPAALDVTLQCSDTAGLTTAQANAPIATDNCGGTVTYTKVSGAFVAGNCVNSGTYTNTWTATDVCTNVSTVFTQTITIQDTTAPTWTTAPAALDVTLQCSDTAGLTTAQANAPIATDNCGGTVTYTKVSGAFVAGNCVNSGTYTNTWTATDVCTNVSTVFTQTITIQDTTAPTWTTAPAALDVTLQCSDTAGLTTAQANAPIATDNCGGTVTYTKVSGAFVAGNCINSGTYTNTWTATDVCTNVSTVFTQTITIQDTTAPTWTTAPAALDVTLQCSDTAGLTTAQANAPVATDNCGGTVTYTKVSGQFQGGNCGSTGTYTNTWTANDVCNNTSTVFTQVITVQDTAIPTWITQAGTLDTTLQCSDAAGLTAAQNQAPTATANCSTVTYTKTNGQFVASASCSNAGTYTNTWVAVDNCGNTSGTFTQVITIEDTTAPTWTTAPAALDVTLQCSDTAGLTTAQANAPIATDNCGGTVTYTKVSGAFVAGNCINSGTYTNTWTATDVCTNVSTVFTQTITIQDTTAPTWTTAPAALDVTLQCSDTAGLTTAQANAPIATDNCGGTVTYTKVSGAFVAGNCVNSGTYTNTWTATDVCTNVSTVFTQTITIQDTTAPTWTTTPAALDVTLQCSDTAGLTTAQANAPIATDNCGGTVTYTKVSGQFQGGNCGSTGTYTNTWTANDVCNNTSTVFTQVITVQDTAIPTWITQAGTLDTTLQCSDAAGLTAAQNQAPTATANCSTVTYTKSSGQFVASGSCSNAGTYTNTWVAVDNCGNTSGTFTQVITIEDTTAPTWTTAPAALDVTLQCSDTAGLTTAQANAPIATDNCGGTVTYTKISGAFVAGNCINSGTYTNTWTATDVCTNVSTVFTQTITIQDTTAPTWTTAPAALDVTLQCSDTAALTTAQANAPIATDNCGGTVTYTKVSGAFVAGNCVNSGTYTNTWTATDVCTNVSTVFTQTITIQDTTAPTWTTAPAALDVTLQCSDTAGLTTAQANAPIATDNCGGTVTYTKVSGAFVAGNCINSGTYTNTWTATDVCTNVSTVFTQTITIQDTTAPTWTTAPAALDVTLQCSDTAGLTTAQANAPVATDNCGGTVTYTKVSGQFQGGNCGSTGTYTNTWTANDVCNNTSTVFTQVITVQDTAIPTWITQAGTLDTTLQCSDAAGLTAAQNQAPTATANCSTVTYTKTNGQFVASASCSNAGTYTNTWVAVDNCGNTSGTFTQVITIEDTTKPTWTTLTGSLDITIQCSDAAGLIAAQASAPVAIDNCDNDVTNIVKTSGQFVASQSCGNSGTYTNTWTVKDNCGNTSDTFTQVITIEDTTKPIWTTLAGSLDITIQCSDAAGLIAAQANAPVATDNCDSDVTNIVKTSGQFVASQSCGNSGTYTNTWTVKDNCGNTSDTFTQVITIEDTTKPTWTTQAGSLDITIQCSDAAGLIAAQANAPVATDNCDSDVTNIVKTSGQFVASTSCGNSGTYTNTWTVKDNCGNTSDTFTQVITIEDTTKPTWTTLAGSLDITIQCSDAAGLIAAQANAPVATDNCDSDVTNIVKTSGQFVASTSCGNSGTYTNTWTVKDNCGNTSDTFTQVITIEDTTKPTWTTLAGSLNKTIQCSDTEGLTTAQASAPVATDNCDSDVTIEKTTGQFVPSATCANAGTYTNSWVAKDNCNNITDTFTQVITIEDTSKPVFNGVLPANITVSCDKVPPPANITASDNCNANVPVVYTETKNSIENECSTNYTLTRTWTSSDCSGNTTSYTQLITVRDTTPPTGTIPANVTLQNIADIPVANTGAVTNTADNCSQTVTATVSDSNNGGTGCGSSPYILTRTYTLSDCAGNKTILVQTITVLHEIVATAPFAIEACNADTSTVDLLGPLPRNTSTTGTWIDTNNTGALNGSVVTTFGLPIGNYSFEYQIKDEACPRSLVVNLSINDDCKVLACGTILVHNAFSPNNDGINDRFVIDHIEDTACYPDNSVEIYNRWGVLVFDTKNYNNTTNAFDGISRGRTTVSQSDGLPTGTYFYILNYTSVDGNGAIQMNKKDGYLYLSR